MFNCNKRHMSCFFITGSLTLSLFSPTVPTLISFIKQEQKSTMNATMDAKINASCIPAISSSTCMLRSKGPSFDLGTIVALHAKYIQLRLFQLHLRFESSYSRWLIHPYIRIGIIDLNHLFEKEL